MELSGQQCYMDRIMLSNAQKMEQSMSVTEIKMLR